MMPIHSLALLAELVFLGRFEEPWAYVPEAELWIEIGRNERASLFSSEVETDIDFLEVLVDRYPELQLFHIHPAIFLKRRTRAFAAQLARNPAGAVRPDRIAAVNLALPSPEDISTSIHLTMHLVARNPDARLTHALVSSLGVVTYGPTPTGLRRLTFESGDPRAFRARSIAGQAPILGGMRNIARVMEALGGTDFGELMTALCDQMSDPDYELKYEVVPTREALRTN
jgi:hypothetical protein